MQIEKITISKEELAQAVQEFLFNRFDLNVKVQLVAKDFYYSTDYTVDIEDPKAKMDEEIADAAAGHPCPKGHPVAEALLTGNPLAELKENE